MKNKCIRILNDGSLYEPVIFCPQCGEPGVCRHSDNLYYKDHLFFTVCKTYRVYGCGSCGCRFEVYDSTETKFHKIQSGWLAMLATIIILGAFVALIFWLLVNFGLVNDVRNSSILIVYPFRSLAVILSALALSLALIDWKESLDL